MKKAINAIVVTLGAIVILLIGVLAVSAVLYTPGYVYRVVMNGESKITDYHIFPERVITKSAAPYEYGYAADDTFGSATVQYRSGDKQVSQSLDVLLEENGTTSCIVIKNDKVLYEKYFNGHDKNSIETSFSSVKSLVSLMIGIAVEDGFIKNVNQSIADYIPEFAGTDFEDITIENLLMMRSKIVYKEGVVWFTDDAKTYYMPDLRDLALHHMHIDPDYAGQFHYNNYHPLLLGIILERATGMSVSGYFQQKIFIKVGAEHDASWSLDSERSGFEKMESGLNFMSIDYAKIGSMLLHNGKWNGNTVVSESWIKQSTIAPVPLKQSDVDSWFLKDTEVGYQYMWYSIKNGKGGHDFFSAGKYGQYIYISPENDTVIVRTGMSTGVVDWWPDVFSQMTEIIHR